MDDVLASERSLGLAAVDASGHTRNLNTGWGRVNDRGYESRIIIPSCRKNDLTPHASNTKISTVIVATS